jgi:hypothetical protein
MREFKFLGSILIDDNNITIEIKQRILIGNRGRCGLEKQLSSRYLRGQTKCALVRPLSRNDENILQIF